MKETKTVELECVNIESPYQTNANSKIYGVASEVELCVYSKSKKSKKAPIQNKTPKSDHSDNQSKSELQIEPRSESQMSISSQKQNYPTSPKAVREINTPLKEQNLSNHSHSHVKTSRKIISENSTAIKEVNPFETSENNQDFKIDTPKVIKSNMMLECHPIFKEILTTQNKIDTPNPEANNLQENKSNLVTNRLQNFKNSKRNVKSIQSAVKLPLKEKSDTQKRHKSNVMSSNDAPNDLNTTPQNHQISPHQNGYQSTNSNDLGSMAPQQQANSHFLESEVSEGRRSDHNSTISSTSNIGNNNLTFGVQSIVKKIKTPTSLLQVESQSKGQIPIIKEEKTQISNT